MTGLERTAATTAIYRTRRTWARPPQIQRLPRKLPLSRLKGASPTSAAICLRLSAPSSGKCASRVVESTFPTPGTEPEQLVALAPDRGLADQTGEFVVEPGEPLFQPADVLINAFVDHLGRIGPAILFRREHLNQLPAAVHEGFERLGLRVSQRSLLGF